MVRNSAARSSRRARRPLSTSALCGLVLLASAEAWALPPDRCQADRDCRQLTELASSLAGQAQYEEALATYQRAYERVPEPRLLVNLGRCHFRLGHHQKALGLYRALQKSIPDLPPELDSKVKQFIAEAEDALSKDPKSATTGVATRPAPPNSAPPNSAPASAAPPSTASPSTATTETTADRPVGLAPDASARAESPAVGALPSGAVATASTPAAVDTSGRRPSWRIAVGIGALAVGAAGLAAGAWALSEDGRCVAQSTLFPGRCLTTMGPDGQLMAQVRNGLPGGISLVVSGGLLLATGVVLLALPGPRTAPRTAMTTKHVSIGFARALN